MGLINRAWRDIKALPGATLDAAKAGANEMLPHANTPWGATPRFGGANGPDASTLTKGIFEQYKGIARDPVGSFENHPINTLLALSPLKTLRSENAIVKAGEGASAREALVRAATQNARVHGTAGTSPSEMMAHLRGQVDPPVSKVSMATKAEGVARARSAHAIRSGLSKPTEFGTSGLTGKGWERIGQAHYFNGERTPADEAGYNRFMKNRAVEYYAKQPEYKPQPPVNEGPAGSAVRSPGRELFDFSKAGQNASDSARFRQGGFASLPLDKLMQMMERAHASGNVDLGDNIANYIQKKHGFDPYEHETPPALDKYPSRPPKGAPSFMAPYSMPNLQRRFPSSNN